MSESASYKAFANVVPDRWVLRDVTERDYGIDCYIELVNSKDQLTGDLVSVQLKGVASINWNKSNPNRWTISGIERSTTNYWNNFTVPVFLCVVDNLKREVFFINVKAYIRANFERYQSNGVFSYTVDKRKSLGLETELEDFVSEYYREKDFSQLEVHTIAFLSNCARYQEFSEVNSYRDAFLPVEESRVLYSQFYYNNLYFLCSHFEIPWRLETWGHYRNQAKNFGDHAELFEQQLSDIVTALQSKLQKVYQALRTLVLEDEAQYWSIAYKTCYYIAVNFENVKDIRDD